LSHGTNNLINGVHSDNWRSASVHPWRHLVAVGFNEKCALWPHRYTVIRGARCWLPSRMVIEQPNYSLKILIKSAVQQCPQLWCPQKCPGRGEMILAFKEKNLLASYVSPEAQMIDSDLFDKQGYWYTYYVVPVVLGYNANLVKREEIPRNYTDLLEPKWKGKKNLDGYRSVSTSSRTYLGLGQREGPQFYEATRGSRSCHDARNN